MYVVKLEIHAIRDGEVASGTFLVQRLRNNTWSNERELTFVSKDVSSQRNIALEDDQRLVISAKSNVQTTMDRAQMAHVTVQPDLPKPNGNLRHPGVKRYIPPRHEDEGTNDTGVPLSEQAAYEFEELKRREMIQRVRDENARRAQEAAQEVEKAQKEREAIHIPPPPVQKPPAIRVNEGASKG